jgi:hypothetical protein
MVAVAPTHPVDGTFREAFGRRLVTVLADPAVARKTHMPSMRLHVDEVIAAAGWHGSTSLWASSALVIS